MKPFNTEMNILDLYNILLSEYALKLINKSK